MPTRSAPTDPPPPLADVTGRTSPTPPRRRWLPRLGPGRARLIRFEQAVYGSFAFRDAGYAILARSPGCRDEWVADLRAACQAVGEPPAGVVAPTGLLALRLPSGVWAIVGISPTGSDDRGRPGALAFHALFVGPRAYRQAGADPFVFAAALRDDWSPADTTLPPGLLAIPDAAPAPEATADDPRVGRVVEALTRGRRVLIESPAPIDALARATWARLPARVRARKTLATWAFGNAHRFDLVAVPRLAGVGLDESYLPPAAFSSADLGAPAEATAPTPVLPRRHGPRGRARLVAMALGIAATAAALPALRGRPPGREAAVKVPAAPAPPREPAQFRAGPPPRAAFPPAPGDDDPAERRRVSETLIDLADRVGVVTTPEDAAEPAALMERLADALRYRGPRLGDAERTALAADPGRDAALALEWDRLVRRFDPGRPLPADFRDGPLRWQLGVLAWSWHHDLAAGDPGPGSDRPGRSASELTQEVLESLAVDASLRASLLASRSPALTAYLEFLGRLPRR